jgi:hypothetical protein
MTISNKSYNNDIGRIMPIAILPISLLALYVQVWAVKKSIESRFEELLKNK